MTNAKIFQLDLHEFTENANFEAMCIRVTNVDNVVEQYNTVLYRLVTFVFRMFHTRRAFSSSLAMNSVKGSPTTA